MDDSAVAVYTSTKSKLSVAIRLGITGQSAIPKGYNIKKIQPSIWIVRIPATHDSWVKVKTS